MRILRKWLVKLASSMAVLAMLVAVSSVGSACVFTAYQPDVPESLQ
ncbi:MAG: cyclic lactone autoinducer peptide [Oscillospiraceae bacterium]|nr:cyclic lactone autoinducer peptide [Oscillospiraceae bacterium]